MFQSFELKFMNETHKTNNKQCLCYKDLLLSFLILIDYQFNEKFICGAKLSIETCFNTKISSYCLLAPSLATRNEDQQQEDSIRSSTNCDLNERTNRYMFLLIMRCCNALVSVFNNQFDKQIDDKKLKFYESIKEDYRLKNFYCLYSLADSNYEDYLSKNMSKSQLSSGSTSMNHLYSSFNSLRDLFKSYMDDYFHLE